VEDQLAQAAPLGRMLVPLQPLGTQAPAAAAAVLTRQQEVQRSLAALGELDGRLDALREQAGALGSLFARDGVVLEAVLGGPPAGALSARYSPRRASACCGTSMSASAPTPAASLTPRPPRPKRARCSSNCGGVCTTAKPPSQPLRPHPLHRPRPSAHR
jgi:hypothetical protein